MHTVLLIGETECVGDDKELRKGLPGKEIYPRTKKGRLFFV